jgi:energy-coupling factor transporter ATP-binding protein EcfA2
LERQVAQAVASRLIADAEPLLPVAEVMAVLSRYEEAEGIELNAEQRHAVQLAADKAFTLITGGAGVGKTTVLKALYEVYHRAGVTITQGRQPNPSVTRRESTIEHLSLHGQPSPRATRESLRPEQSRESLMTFST